MVFGRFGAKHKNQGKYWLPRRDVTMSRRHNVVTLRHRDAWSIEASQQATQRRDISTSQRHHDFCTRIIKCKGRPNFDGVEERTDERTKSRAAAIGIIGEDTSFCIFFFYANKTADDF